MTGQGTDTGTDRGMPDRTNIRKEPAGALKNAGPCDRIREMKRGIWPERGSPPHNGRKEEAYK